MAVFNVTRSLSTYFPDGVDLPTIKESLSSNADFNGCVANATDLVFYFDVDVQQSHIDAVDSAVSSYDHLDFLKLEKSIEIDAKTDGLIDAGYEYPPASGKIFSLSMENQMNLVGTDVLSSDLTYPIRWNTIDDTDYHDVNDATDLHTMLLVASGVKKAHVDSGTALKDSVRAATTIAELEAIVDNR